MRKIGQQYVLNYLNKIPIILADPSIIIYDPEDVLNKTFLYYKEIHIKEKSKQVLFSLVVKLLKERIVYNFFPQESGRAKSKGGEFQPKIVYIKREYKRTKYFKG
ncbi:hypothetical protein H8E88_35505 [candidate division KSB1 bacterium]|nr:hypothetical protein [candidate division KSB1 bacterium]